MNGQNKRLSPLSGQCDLVQVFFSLTLIWQAAAWTACLPLLPALGVRSGDAGAAEPLLPLPLAMALLLLPPEPLAVALFVFSI